jgi:hypothetical protein
MDEAVEVNPLPPYIKFADRRFSESNLTGIKSTAGATRGSQCRLF